MKCCVLFPYFKFGDIFMQSSLVCWKNVIECEYTWGCLKRSTKYTSKTKTCSRCFLVFSQLLSHDVHSLSWILFTHVKFKQHWKSTFIIIFLNTKLINIRSFHISFYWKKKKTFCCGRFIASSSFYFSLVILNLIIMRRKNLYGMNNKNNGLGIVRMFVTTCATNPCPPATISSISP